jgi:hypothetical protein
MVQIPIIAIIGKLPPTSPHHRQRVKRQSRTVVSLIVLTFKHEAGVHTLRTSAIALPYQPWLIARAARPKVHPNYIWGQKAR